MNKTLQAWQLNIIHLYLLAVKLSSEEQAASGKWSLSACYKDHFELLFKAPWRRRPPAFQRGFSWAWSCCLQQSQPVCWLQLSWGSLWADQRC